MNTLYNWIFDQELNLQKNILSTSQVDFTYQDILNEVDQYTDLLQSLGDCKGRKVALIIPDVHRFLPLVLAVSKVGGITIPLSPLLKKEDLENILEFTHPHIVFTAQHVNGFAIGDEVHNWARLSKQETIIFKDNEGLNWYKTVYQGEERPREYENIQLIGCTSGSTGTPKGIVADVDFVSTADRSYIAVSDLTSHDDIFLMAPASGLFGLCWLLSSLHSQYHIVITESFSFPDIMQLLEDKPCQKLITTPSLFRALQMFNQSSERDVLQPLELTTLAGEPITEEFIQSITSISHKINGFYGFSELGGLMYTEEDIRDGLRWSLLPNVTYTFNQNNEGEVGELQFKNGNNFLGYYKRQDLTEEVSQNGWFYSGDLARQREDGKIEIVGRKKDIIKKGGQQVIPGEIERLLDKHSAVKQAVIVGIPHKVFGEQIVGFILTEESTKLDSLFRYCNERLARFKVPDQFYEIDEIPIKQGKIDKVTLKQLAIQKNTPVQN